MTSSKKSFITNWPWLIIMVVFLLAVIGVVLSVHGQTIPRVAKTSTSSPTREFNSFDPVVVGLPAGQKLIQIIPDGDTSTMIIGKHNRHIYVTADRLPNEPPRRITFYEPGYSPGSLEPILYIQEH